MFFYQAHGFISDFLPMLVVAIKIEMCLYHRPAIFHIAAGYEEANDANTLRHDPIVKLLLDRLPETGAPLASQPTISPSPPPIAGLTQLLSSLAHVLPVDCRLRLGRDQRRRCSRRRLGSRQAPFWITAEWHWRKATAGRDPVRT